jgi:hypothetical protein
VYLKILYKEWRALFWGVMTAILLQFIFMSKAIETVPFFLYNMFGFAHPSKQSYKVMMVKTDQGYINPYQLSNREEELLLNNILYYKKLQQLKGIDYVVPVIHQRFDRFFSNAFVQYAQRQLANDSTTLAAYPSWWKRYYTTCGLPLTHSVTLVESEVKYFPRYEKLPNDSIIIQIEF